MKLSQTDLRLLSSTKGLIALLSIDKPDYQEVLHKLKYEKVLSHLQIDLLKMQNWVVENDQRILIIFEGGEFAGKGGAIRAFTEHLNPRSQRTVALPKPTAVEAGQWYFQRYVLQLPKPGEMVFFDRSWYNRAIVEPVNKFCTEKEYQQFMKEVNHFESMLDSDGIILIKLYFMISKGVQARRLDKVRKNPLRRWELTEVDENAQKLWNTYKAYEKEMFEQTDTDAVPWKIIDSDHLQEAYLEAIRHVLKTVPVSS